MLYIISSHCLRATGGAIGHCFIVKGKNCYLLKYCLHSIFVFRQVTNKQLYNVVENEDFLGKHLGKNGKRKKKRTSRFDNNSK